MKKILITLLITLLCVPAGALAFSDVDDLTHYNNAIEWLSDEGVIEGYPDGSFKPHICVNRAEMLKMLFELRGTEFELGGESSFSDVNKDDWFYFYVKGAADLEIVEGYEDGTFRPGECVKRAEAIKMAINEFGFDTEYVDQGENMYVDVDTDEWFAPFVYSATQKNLVGTNHVKSTYNKSEDVLEREFFPANVMTRKEVAEMLLRMKLVEFNGVTDFTPDLTFTEVEAETETETEVEAEVEAETEPETES